MLKKYFRSTIIIMLYTLLPLALIIIFASQVTQTHDLLYQTKQFFTQHRHKFLLIHCLFYLTLFILWPKVIDYLAKRRQAELAPEQITLAVTSRYYLLTALAFFEILFWWK